MENQRLQLIDGSRVGVIGGGPAGSFFSYFLISSADRIGINLQVDIYEPRSFSNTGPSGCNMCGGIISESLVQMLSSEGIILPPTVVQRGIESYMLHTDLGTVKIETPIQEKRIGSVYRGSGPRDIKEIKWGSFDGHVQSLAIEKGANVIQERVSEFDWDNGRPVIKTRSGPAQEYDLVAAAAGVNSSVDRLFAGKVPGYEPPRTTKTFIQEYYLGADVIEEVLGASMHVFLLDIDRLEFAAIIPKGDYVSVCLLGDDIDKELVASFLSSPEVRNCLPDEWNRKAVSCWCSPKINIAAAGEPSVDRIVFIGDSGVTRLYKDGIGAAYRTSKAAATAAVFQGISAEDFKQFYSPACKSIESDNNIGKFIFLATRQIQKRRFARDAVMRMTAAEQQEEGINRRMSMILWDMFTGSSPYRDILKRTFNPKFWLTFTRELASALVRPAKTVR
jgi:flavin-dependent dehydrogenase